MDKIKSLTRQERAGNNAAEKTPGSASAKRKQRRNREMKYMWTFSFAAEVFFMQGAAGGKRSYAETRPLGFDTSTMNLDLPSFRS